MSEQARPSWDIHPNSPQPPEPLIEAVLRDVPPTLADMENTTEYGAGRPELGQRIVLCSRLVQALVEKRQHGKAAAEWAIHRLVEQEMLIIRPGRSSTPGVIGWDGAWEVAPIFYEIRDLSYSLVYSTPRLWEWWRERHQEQDNAKRTYPVCEAGVGDADPVTAELPATLEQLRDWLAERVRWLRDWHLAADPKPLAPGLQAIIVQKFRRTSRDFPNNPQYIPRWASQFIWKFSEVTAHQAHACLERLGILDAPAWPSPDIENDMRALIVALDHLAALLAFVAQRLVPPQSLLSSNRISATSAPSSCQGAEQSSQAAAPRDSVGQQKPKPRHKQTMLRDKWIYRQCCKGTPHDVIVAQLKRMALQRGWRIVSTKQRIQQIGIEYAQQHSLPLPPSRKNL